MVWSFALPDEAPSVLLLPFWLINVPGEVGLVVRKPTTMARVPSISNAFFQSINYDWCSCFSGEPGNGPWSQGRDTVGWETVFGEWICLQTLNSNKQHSSYMVWLATKTSELFVDPKCLRDCIKKTCVFIWKLGSICYMQLYNFCIHWKNHLSFVSCFETLNETKRRNTVQSPV